ncbi:MAG: hypothetical protein OIF55_12240, partial [Amphritea sp.]|nr:hypothetical protein [Amphritea sp.]
FRRFIGIWDILGGLLLAGDRGGRLLGIFGRMGRFSGATPSIPPLLLDRIAAKRAVVLLDDPGDLCLAGGRGGTLLCSSSSKRVVRRRASN